MSDGKRTHVQLKAIARIRGMLIVHAGNSAATHWEITRAPDLKRDRKPKTSSKVMSNLAAVKRFLASQVIDDNRSLESENGD